MIRTALKEDVDALIKLGMVMHAESRYSRLSFDAEKTAKFFESLVDSENGCLFVAEKNSQIIGGFAGIMSEHYFSRDTIASDLALFILPEHRGGATAARLLYSFVAWGKFKKASMIHVGITTMVNHEKTAKFFETCGGRLVGSVYEFGGNQ